MSRLTIAVGVLLAVTIAAPFIDWWLYGEWTLAPAVAVGAVTIPMAGFSCLTVWQQRRRAAVSPTFGARALEGAAWVCVAAVLAQVLGYVGFLLDLVFLIPIFCSLLAIAWVQPSAVNEVMIGWFGAVVPPLVVWFGLRADGHAGEGIISGAWIVVIVAVLGLFRVRARTSRAKAD